MVWMQLRPVLASSRIRRIAAICMFRFGVLDRRRRPDSSHQLVPQYKVSGPVEKHVENVKGTRADRHRHESTDLVTPEQNAGLPVEPEVLELEDATPGHAPSCLPRID